MPQPRFEIPSGSVDGVNTIFVVSSAYQPGSVAVFLNGQLKTRGLDDGWVESDPVVGEVTLKEAPRGDPGDPDVVQIFFIDTSPALPETVVECLVGTITSVSEDALQGVLSETLLQGSLDDHDDLLGLVSVEELSGAVAERGQLNGVLEVC